jgi:hypothetical protein
MKKLIIVLLFILLTFKITAQQSIYKYSSSDTAKLLLYNCLNPRAVMNNNKDIICVATDWSTQFPLVAKRLDSSGNLLWNNVYIAPPLNDLDENGDAVILPRPDGGAYFIFEYLEFKSVVDTPEFLMYFASYPHIQYVDAEGNPQWGPIGKRLSDIKVDFQGGVDIKSAYYAPDGDIIIYWNWYNDHHTAGLKNEFGTYVQKIDPTNGELKFGESGRKLFNFRASPLKQSPNGNIYIFQDRYTFQNGGDSVACFNNSAEKLWQLPLLTGINSMDYLIGTNDFGELLIIYGTNNDIRANLYDENGSPKWTEKLICSSFKRLVSFTIAQWDSNKWVFKIMGDSGNSVFCIDRNGNAIWGDTGIKFLSGIYPVQPLDNGSILVALGKSNESGFYANDLYLQKLNKNGVAVWQSGGIKVFEYVSTNCIIIPDKDGGAYLIFDAVAQDEPNYKPRGIYFQKVDKDGNLGIITSVKNERINLPVKFILFQNYPNPFNPTTTITYSIPVKSSVKLSVFDMLGRKVRTLVDGNKSQGEYKTEFNCTGLASGTYIIIFETPQGVLSKKITLIK